MGGTGDRSDSDHGLKAECIQGKKSQRVGESERSELQTWTSPRGNTQASDGQTRPSRAKSRQQLPHAIWTLSHTIHSHIITPIFCHLIIHISHSQYARCTVSNKRIEHSHLLFDLESQSLDHSHTPLTVLPAISTQPQPKKIRALRVAGSWLTSRLSAKLVQGQKQGSLLELQHLA